MYDAFISYSRKDLATVGQLEQSCDSLRLKVFFDSASLRAAETWPAQLGDSIKNARLLALCWSSAAAASDWVQAEIKFALMAQKTILPWRLDRTPLPNNLKNIHALAPTDPASKVAELLAAHRRRHQLRTLLTTTAAAVILVPSAWFASDRLTPKSTTFQGAIRDEQDHPIAGVAIEAAGQHTTTGPNGEFRLTLPVSPNTRQTPTVLISKPGYRSQTIDTQTDVPLTRILEKGN
jgi:hypothetical protein